MESRNEPLVTLAVRKGHKATVAALIEAGADVNARDYVRTFRLCMLALGWPATTYS